MENEISLKVGTKLSEAETKALDPQEVGWLQAQPPKADVQGQIYPQYVFCPYCCCIGAEPAGTVSCSTYCTCHCCGAVFKR
jgi:hypothetical protein